MLYFQVEQWSGEAKHNLTSDIARDILKQLSPGGILMQGVSQTSMAGEWYLLVCSGYGQVVVAGFVNRPMCC